MLPSPSRAPSAPPDMTQHWDRRGKLIGGQALSDSKLRRDGAGSSLRPRTLRAAKLAGSRSYSTTSTTIASYRQTNVQVNRLVKFCLLGLMLALTLDAQPTMATHSDSYVNKNNMWIETRNDYVVFRSQICQPQSLETLQKRLDDEKTKDNVGDESPESKQDSDYQQDDPGSDLTSDLVENVDTLYDDKDSKTTEGKNEEEEGAEENRSKSRGLARKEQKKSERGKQDVGVKNRGDVGAVPSSPEYPYMRRRRRSTDVPETPAQDAYRAPRDAEEINDFTKEHGVDRLANEHKKTEKKSGQLYLRLFETGRKNKAARKQIKQRIRQSPDFRNGSTPWDCHYELEHKMTKGFPAVYQDGKCTLSKCFYKLYTCVPILYQVKFLTRNHTVCNPLPLLTNFTIYEERWDVKSLFATVGCNCKYVKPSRFGG